jgi:murein DD-endopeptidase MepM/ murein hydrolase activator NlpD
MSGGRRGEDRQGCRLVRHAGVLAMALAGMPALARAEVPLLPVAGACVSSPFGWRHAVGPRAPAGFHNGIDLPAPAGGWVRAVAAGSVMRIRRMGIGGLQVDLRHIDGSVTIYAHLGSVAPALAEGKRTVRAGEVLGRVGRTGVTYGTHLFFMRLDRGRAVDPQPWLGIKPC